MGKYKMYLVLGDWSDDGHGKSDKILVETNKPVADIQKAYKASCKLTGVSFNHNDDFTGIKETVEDFGGDYDKYFQAQNDRRIACEYEEPQLSKSAFETLSKFGLTEDLLESFGINKFYICTESFVPFWFWFTKLSLPDLEYKVVEDNEVPVINGYWNKKLNVQFGYGLYH